jgi:transposase
MNKRVYSRIGISRIDVDKILSGRDGLELAAGLDVGKLHLCVVLRWGKDDFERPWDVSNPDQIPLLVQLLKRLGTARQLKVAMEPTGTYGDALRQALADAGIELQLVSGKRAHDYAEVFDGTPSQHDGKDAAVIAELCALGKSSRWPFAAEDQSVQHIALMVEQMEAANQLKGAWLQRTEGLLGRYWPEATRHLPLSSTTMMRTLAHYGGPTAMREDTELEQRLRRWSRGHFKPARLGKIIASARSTLGVRQTPVDQQHVRWCASQALAAHLEVIRCQKDLNKLGADHPLIARQGKTLGIPTAALLWTHLGDPRQYHCAAAYRKAMGLNLKERSSGKYQGQLKITKRGSGAVRQWLYMSALRLIRNEPKIKRWYQRKLKRGMTKMNAITALMRKLAISIWAMAMQDQAFDVQRMLGSAPVPQSKSKKGALVRC